MKDPFTMTEYIEEHKLGVSIHDAGATRLIAKHLTEKGYRKFRARRDGKVASLWTKSRNQVEFLAEKLKKLK